MTEKSDSGGGILEELTPEEQKVLSKALKRIETDIFNNVIKRLSVFIGIVLSILLIGGLVNFSSCSSNVENSASQKLVNDPELRDKIINKTQVSFTDIQEKLKGLNEQTLEIERQNARAAATFVNDLEQIRFMIQRINNELLRRLPADNKNQATTGKERK
jgi:hypothetical protein